ncbi:hypothetical protein QTO01_18190 [Vibrio mytili]|uniref:hypothetical protein n=1 Tax=Vibrio harveyi group TaxID=717610 RepID=UPI002F41F60D
MQVKKGITALLFTTVLSGCQSMVSKPDMPEQNYNYYATLYVAVGECLEKNHYSMNEAQRMSDAVGYAINSWKYDPITMNKDINRINRRYSNMSSSYLAKSCSENRKYLVRLMTDVEQVMLNDKRKHEVKVANATAIANTTNSYNSNTLKNTVQCKSIDIMNPEIKTFNGVICPIGWLKVF